MKPAELVRRLRRLATREGWEFELTEGSRHSKVRLNGRFAPVPRHSADMPRGTVRAILRQLNLAPEDIEDR